MAQPFLNQMRRSREQDAFDTLVSEAERQAFSGWDFSYINGRYEEGRLSWDYSGEVLRRTKRIDSLLDLGTGGGEFLSSLGDLPREAFATEGYPSNVAIARKRLEPRGVKVVRVYSHSLPFDDDYFDLVINRHESFSPVEVYRVLKPGGTFLTQQVGGRNNIELNRLLGAPLRYPNWNLESAAQQLRAAGFRIIRKKEDFPNSRFYDVGALVHYLKRIPWQVPDFSSTKYRKQLLMIHRLIQDNGALEVTMHRFYIEAKKPCSKLNLFSCS